MDDLIVVLPGIMGSVLEKHGRVAWDATAAALWAAASSRGGSITGLKLVGDEGRGDEAADGVVATRLVEDLTVLPFFWKIDGYTGLFEALIDRFKLEDADPDDDAAGNLVRFPYDWRRDVRVTARLLARVVERKLALWRREAGTPRSRAILIAHSMGGLVARYALECLGLWRSARALITFGTPYRGAPRALDYLVNGRALTLFGVRWLEVTEALRSFPAAYQLLPRYPVLETPDGVRRVSEVGAAALGLDPALLHHHAELHRELDAAIARNAGDAEYLASPYRTIPVIGHGQPTLLGARWRDAVLSSTTEQPHWLPAEVPDGDGTVPRLAAVPTDQSGPGEFRGLFAAQAHESLQSDDAVMADLVARLEYFQAPGLEPYRGGAETGRGALGVAIADASPAGRPVAIRARAIGAPVVDGPALEALVSPADGETAPVVVPLEPRDDGWSAGEAPGLAPGFYRATVRASGTARARFGAVTTGFAMVEAEPGAVGA